MWRALEKAESILCTVWQQQFIKFYSKAEQIERGWQCTHYVDVAAIVDCTVQQCNRPVGRHGKIYEFVEYKTN